MSWELLTTHRIHAVLHPKSYRDMLLGVFREAHLTARGSPHRRAPERPAPTRTMRSHTDSLLAVAFFKDGRRFVTASHDKTLRICDIQKGSSVGEPFEGHKDYVRSVAVSPDDKKIASSGDDKAIIVWDVESKQMIFGLLEKHSGWVLSVCFSPDGKRLASGSHDKTAVVWDAETGRILATFDGHNSSVCSVAFSPDGLKLASGSADRSIRIWNSDNAELLLEIDAHQHWVRSVVWSPDGQQLVSASLDKTVKFWSSDDGTQIGQPCTGHAYQSLAISSDGSFIATASDDKTLRLWSTKTHKLIGQVLEHATWVRCVAISPNGEMLVSGDGEGKVLLCSIKNILKQYNAEEGILENEEAQKQRLSFSETQSCNHEGNKESICNHGSPSNNPSEIDEDSVIDDVELFDFLAIQTTLHDASITDTLHTAEELLTQEIHADDNSYKSYANRSVVRARRAEWKNALQDAVKSIAIQPSLLGYISKGIALCGNGQLCDAMEAFDLAFIFYNHNPIIVDLLLLIKAVSIFNASRRDEAMRRVQDLATTYQHPGRFPCSVINSYLRAQLAIIDFENGRYSEAADQLTISISGGLLHPTLLEPKLKIFTVLFGWDLDSLWETTNQRRCDALLLAGRVIEAVESFQYMMNMINEAGKGSCIEWSTTFKQGCTRRCVAKAREAVAASNYEMAVALYSAAIALDSSSESLFVDRSKVNLKRQFYAEALHDAEKVIELNPSSYLGYEIKHVALHKAQRYGEAIEAFTIMFSKLDHELRRQYTISPSEAEGTIRQVIHAQLENAPLRLLDTSAGHLCNREAQIRTFLESTEYTQLLYSLMVHAPLKTELITELITEAVTKYFSWVMLSHRWEQKEPLLHDILDRVVYDLDPVGAMVKLQTFCKTARDAGYRWAWSDTCCIDQHNNVELQRSVNSMFVWYRRSALTIVYLSDVSSSAKSGTLANSAWNTRGWTIQELLAPVVVLFYRADWTLYLDDRSYNHKMSATIMHELQNSTGIDALSLATFRPGMKDVRGKLQWASSRATTLQEDIAYSLFGIFGIHIPIIYGETKQNALGRLIQEIVARSGDITALDWIGRSSPFNSCLPADITSYKAPPCILSSLPGDEMWMPVSRLQDVVAVESATALYTRLHNLSAPRFANSRLRLPCITFPVIEVRRRGSRDRETCFTYYVKADGLQDLTITTEDKLTQFSRARPTRQTFLLARPWNRCDLGLLDFEDDESIKPISPPWSDRSLGGSPSGYQESVDSELPSRALRLMVRLGQAFGAFLLAQQHGGEYKRIASDHNIVAQVKDITAIHDTMDIRTLEIL
ncbi:uncharacterized protein EDB93DRAFT_1249232 [Suillus bovinus]|uniref:uncharacterized protein n=1 Tax=Suillus bovinus TaxID=48563 RepID=UPI001B884AA6|nr:uncharacterized protein EDB93DRAFT_1249232 [Suillus bovinus]KAG2151591.1 hypothetical protein EDB93DRAFT_1249232 [Suillus bovinus]